MSAYKDIVEGVADDAAFLFILRDVMVNQPHCYRDDINKIDTRLEKKLAALMATRDVSWELCLEALHYEQAGEIFMAAICAFSSQNSQKIQHVVNIATKSEEGIDALAWALSWLPGHLCHAWIKTQLQGQEPQLTYIAMMACSLRREDPRHYLTVLFKQPENTQYAPLYARAVRLIGELKRADLIQVLDAAIHSEHSEVVFWATWSQVLLGNTSAAKDLKPFILSSHPHQLSAVELAFRVLPIKTAHAWISELAKNPAHIRTVIQAVGALGDPQAINWLMVHMRTAALAKLSGEAFTSITGINLIQQGWVVEASPATDDTVDMDEDEHLPLPDAEKIATQWQPYQQQHLQHPLVAGQRYLLGQPITLDHLQKVYTTGNQRQRRAAALELALLQPSHPLLNHAKKGTIAL